MNYSLVAAEPLFLRARRPPPYVPGPGAKRAAAEVGRRLKDARRAAGMTRDALGRALGVGTQTLRRYETGERRIPPARLAAAAVLLGLPLSWFFREADAPGEDGEG